MTLPEEAWRPSASRERLLARAALLRQAREFFAARGVLEVDTPALVNAPVSDVHIHSARVQLEPGAGAGAAAPAPAASLYLHTSPEYAMKRLLAAGSGDIYQICHVFRGQECGPLHNPEFTLLEWYRLGFTLDELMSEVETLARALLGSAATGRRSERRTYRELFLAELGLDPLEAATAELSAAAQALGFRAGGRARATHNEGGAEEERDALLELLMAAHIGPRLGRGALTFVHGYPASQAALARLDPGDARVAERFELYCEGIELANGFRELTAPAEQRARFTRDNLRRQRLGLAPVTPDERLLAALAAGLPDCAGVALGFDRLAMLATGADRIATVLAFPTARA